MWFVSVYRSRSGCNYPIANTTTKSWDQILSDLMHQKTFPIWRSGKLLGHKKWDFDSVLHYLRSTWVKKFRAGNIPGISTTNSTVTISVTYAGSSYARQALCLIKSEIKKWNSACYSEWNGKVRGMSNGGSRAPLSKPINPCFTVTTPPIKQLAETFRPCLLQVPQKFRNLRTPYIFTQHNTHCAYLWQWWPKAIVQWRAIKSLLSS